MFTECEKCGRKAKLSPSNLIVFDDNLSRAEIVKEVKKQGILFYSIKEDLHIECSCGNKLSEF